MMRFDAVFERGVLRPLEAVKLGDGEIVRVEVSLPRSPRQHAFLFACIRKAFENWPEDHWFQPMDEEQLRYWLEIEAGWGDGYYFKNPLDAMQFMSKNWKEKMWAKPYNEGFVVYVAKSIAYNKMKKHDFETMVKRLDNVLITEAGFGLMELKMSVVEDVK